MTDNKTIKELFDLALLFERMGDLGKAAIINNAIDLISRQKKENEHLQIMLDAKINANFALTVLRSHKEEGIKEFAQKLKERNKVYSCNKSDLEEMNMVIDILVRETTEEKE